MDKITDFFHRLYDLLLAINDTFWMVSKGNPIIYALCVLVSILAIYIVCHDIYYTNHSKYFNDDGDFW